MLRVYGRQKTRVTLAAVYLHCNIDMSTVNGQSVREEAERIKAEFDRISARKKIDVESKMLFQTGVTGIPHQKTIDL